MQTPLALHATSFASILKYMKSVLYITIRFRSIITDKDTVKCEYFFLIQCVTKSWPFCLILNTQFILFLLFLH